MLCCQIAYNALVLGALSLTVSMELTTLQTNLWSLEPRIAVMPFPRYKVLPTPATGCLSICVVYPTASVALRLCCVQLCDGVFII